MAELYNLKSQADESKSWLFREHRTGTMPLHYEAIFRTTHGCHTVVNYHCEVWTSLQGLQACLFLTVPDLPRNMFLPPDTYVFVDCRAPIGCFQGLLGSPGQPKSRCQLRYCMCFLEHV